MSQCMLGSLPVGTDSFLEQNAYTLLNRTLVLALIYVKKKKGHPSLT